MHLEVSAKRLFGISDSGSQNCMCELNKRTYIMSQQGHTLVICSYLDEIRAREVAQLLESLPRILA